jgi:hypothetical protein
MLPRRATAKVCPVRLNSVHLAVPFFAAALPPPVRAKLMMAILGIVALGIGLIAMVILGGIAVKRRARHRCGPSKQLDAVWYKRPLESEVPDRSDATDGPGEAAGDED